MASVDQLVLAYLVQEPPSSSSEVDGRTQVLRSILSCITRQELTLLDLVNACGPALTSTEDSTRSKAVKLLGGVVEGICREQAKSTQDSSTLKGLGRNEVRVLTDFFTEKLSDGPVQLEAVASLSALTASAAFGVGETIQVCKSVFQHVKMSGMVQADRLIIWRLLDCLMARQRRGLKRMGDEFLTGYCALAEGEKDPRNLMVAFKLDKVILTEFDVADRVEDLFDVTFCYFPITFRPAPNDPYGISSEDLQAALRECLSATPRFGILALPLFLDKLQAASANAKKQSLEALRACFPVYGQAIVNEFCLTFWEAFAVEVFHASDADNEALALAALRSLFCTVYPPGVPPAQTSSEPLMDRMLGAVLAELHEPEKQNAKSATSLLAAVITSAADPELVINRTVREGLGGLLTLWRDPDEIAKRAPILDHIGKLLGAVRILAAGQHGLDEIKDELLTILVSGAKAQTSRVQGLKALVELCRVPSLLSSAEVGFAIGSLNEALIDSSEEVSETALDGLTLLVDLYPSELESLTLPLLFGLLPDHAPPPPDSAARALIVRALTALAELCPGPTLFEPVVHQLLSRLEILCASTPKAPTDHTTVVLYAHQILATLHEVTQRKAKRGDRDLPGYWPKIGPRLLAIFVLASVFKAQQQSVASVDRLAAGAAKVVNLLVRRLDLEEQNELSLAMHGCFSGGNLSPLLGDRVKHVTPDLPFLPLAPGATQFQRNSLALWTAAVVAFRQDVHVPGEKLSRFEHGFLLGAVEESTPMQRRAAFQLLCSTVNRRAQDFPSFFSQELPAFWKDAVLSTSHSSTSRGLALQLWAWIAKALIVRSDNRGYSCIEYLLSIFNDAEIGRQAARCLSIVAEEGDEVLSKENYAVVRLLWKQRFFNHILPSLVAGFSTETGALQSVYLVGLASVLKSVPTNVCLAELPKLMPLLLQALRLPDQDLRANVLEALVVLSGDDKAAGVISDHSELLLIAVLDSVVAPPGETRTPAVKVAALQLLSVLPSSIPYTSVHAKKAQIIKMLGQAIDDKSRSVRREAVDCRAKWYSFRANTNSS